MKFRLVLQLTWLLLLASLPAGCGAEERDENELRFAMFAYPEHDELRQRLARQFEKERPGLRVRYEPIAGDYYTKIITMIGAGIEPDIFIVGDYPLYVNDGILLDLTPFISSDPDSGFFSSIHPQLVQNVTINERVYGLMSSLNVKVLFYNKRLFDEAHVPYPNDKWTWKEMAAAAERLTRRSPDGMVLQYGIAIPYNEWHIFIHQNGGRIWNEDGTRCVINSPEAQEAMQFLYDLCERDRLAPSLLDPNEQIFRESFRAGRTAMYLAPTWNASVFAKITNFEWSVAVLPSQKVRWTEAAGTILGVTRNSANPKAAYELLKHLCSPESERMMVEFGATIPIRTGEQYTGYFRNNPSRPPGEGDVYLRSLEFAGPMKTYMSPYVPRVEQEKIMREQIDPFLLGLTTVERALGEVERRLNQAARRSMPSL